MFLKYKKKKCSESQLQWMALEGKKCNVTTWKSSETKRSDCVIYKALNDHFAFHRVSQQIVVVSAGMFCWATVAQFILNPRLSPSGGGLCALASLPSKELPTFCVSTSSQKKKKWILCWCKMPSVLQCCCRSLFPPQLNFIWIKRKKSFVFIPVCQTSCLNVTSY